MEMSYSEWYAERYPNRPRPSLIRDVKVPKEQGLWYKGCTSDFLILIAYSIDLNMDEVRLYDWEYAEMYTSSNCYLLENSTPSQHLFYIRKLLKTMILQLPLDDDTLVLENMLFLIVTEISEILWDSQDWDDEFSIEHKKLFKKVFPKYVPSDEEDGMNVENQNNDDDGDEEEDEEYEVEPIETMLEVLFDDLEFMHSERMQADPVLRQHMEMFPHPTLRTTGLKDEEFRQDILNMTARHPLLRLEEIKKRMAARKILRFIVKQAPTAEKLREFLWRPDGPMARKGFQECEDIQSSLLALQ